jgi:hypothetical protein
LIGVLTFSAATPSAGAQELTQHFDRKDVDKGPRALALVQISDKGKARLVPIAVMMNGKFFDAESYKATPVPMALDFGIVYEGFRAGVSQGIFTITQPGQLNREWIAEGTWLPEGARPKTDTRKYSAPVIDEGGRDEDHPVLHRRAGKRIRTTKRLRLNRAHLRLRRLRLQTRQLRRHHPQPRRREPRRQKLLILERQNPQTRPVERRLTRARPRLPTRTRPEHRNTASH